MDIAAALDHARTSRNGVLATLKRDGRPQLSNITYAVDPMGLIRISITAGRAKFHNLQRDPRASLYVGREDFGAYVVIDGDVTMPPPAAAVDDPTVDELVQLYRSVAGEHPNWDEYRQAMVTDGRTVVRLTPSHAYGWWS